MYNLKTSDEDLQLHPWGITCLVMEPEEKAAYPQATICSGKEYWKRSSKISCTTTCVFSRKR